MDELLMEYADRFHDSFPIFMMMGIDEREIIAIIKKCLKENKPYEIEYEGDTLY